MKMPMIGIKSKR
uniref:Uncharacterized protein n=1 Tax=Solanum lycopersicum TaxID=4081 RepID=A0A3Q7EXB4_SOLLC